MKALSILDEVVHELEQDLNASRIKRLILFASKESWENDQSALDCLDLRDLIEDLCSKYSGIEDIEAVLNSIVAKVNKKTEYALVATTIVHQIGRVYEAEEQTEVETSLSPTFIFQNPTHFQPSINYQESGVGVDEPTHSSHLFDVRQKIVQRTNPLRAKILIFSTLYHEFNFSDRDWSFLKTQEIDGLLRQLLKACPTLADLEARLYRTASNLDNPDESAQAATAIVQSMTPSYAKLLEEHGQEEGAVNLPPSYEETHLLNTMYQDNGMGNDDVSYFRDGEITLVAQGTSNYYYDDVPETPAIPTPTSFTPDYESDRHDPDEDRTVALPLSSPLHSLDSDLTEAEETFPRPVFSANISDSIKQQLNLEEDIKGLVSQSVTIVTNTMERTLSELEISLDRHVVSDNVEEHFSLKYKALQDFIGDVQGFATKLMEILSQLEAKERQSLHPQPVASPGTDSHSAKNHGHKIIDLAKQGHPKAIATWLNHTLTQKGITATAFSKEGYLHIILESAQVPNQSSTTAFVQKKLSSLKSTALNLIRIHGRQTGHKSVAWTQEFEY